LPYTLQRFRNSAVLRAVFACGTIANGPVVGAMHASLFSTASRLFVSEPGSAGILARFWNSMRSRHPLIHSLCLQIRKLGLIAIQQLSGLLRQRIILPKKLKQSRLHPRQKINALAQMHHAQTRSSIKIRMRFIKLNLIVRQLLLQRVNLSRITNGDRHRVHRTIGFDQTRIRILKENIVRNRQRIGHHFLSRIVKLGSGTRFRQSLQLERRGPEIFLRLRNIKTLDLFLARIR
ncbi:MAG: hypothetical protein ACRD3W_23205, partial [Terriglobales bacterium]